MADLAHQTQGMEFGSFGGGPDPFKEEVVRSAFTELHEIKAAADSVKEATQRAKKTGDRRVLNYLQSLANEVMSMLVEFIKKAFVLAIFKFVMELCAQIVQSLVQAMVNKNQKPVEISTQGVFFTLPGQQTPQQTPTTGGQQNSRSSFDNPFGDVFGSNSRSW